MKFDNLPQYVKDNAEFCCWRYETVNNKQTKVPYNPRTGVRASVTKPATFTDFITAVAASVNYSGIGIRVSNGIIGIDLDHCIKDGAALPWALAIVKMFPQAYIEISPSGTGLRILCLAPNGYTYDTDIYYIKRGNIEVYVPTVSTHFVTVTGNVHQSGDIVECTEALQWLLDITTTYDKADTKLEHFNDSVYADKTHQFFKEILEGYSESNTENSKTNFKYREYIKQGDIYKVEETTVITFRVSPKNQKLYTYINMKDREYLINARIDNFNLNNYAYKGLTVNGLSSIDNITVNVEGTLYDDQNAIIR